MRIRVCVCACVCVCVRAHVHAHWRGQNHEMTLAYIMTVCNAFVYVC